MARTIYKYELTPTGRSERMVMPGGSKILAIGNQDERFMLWVEVDTECERESHYFTIYGTGHELPDNPGRYIGTAQFANGSLVLHAYETVDQV
jgi:hypothetical protein